MKKTPNVRTYAEDQYESSDKLQSRINLWDYGSNTQPLSEWIKVAKETEKQGYSTIFQSDHFYKETLDPITMLTTAANHTNPNQIDDCHGRYAGGDLHQEGRRYLHQVP